MINNIWTWTMFVCKKWQRTMSFFMEKVFDKMYIEPNQSHWNVKRDYWQSSWKTRQSQMKTFVSMGPLLHFDFLTSNDRNFTSVIENNHPLGIINVQYFWRTKVKPVANKLECENFKHNKDIQIPNGLIVLWCS